MKDIVMFSSSQVILDQYLDRSVELMRESLSKEREDAKFLSKKPFMTRMCSVHFRLAHYSDALYKSHSERLNSPEWAAAQSVQQHKVEKHHFFLLIHF